MMKYRLNNGINVIIKENKKTPRIAIVMYIKFTADEKIPGLSYLMTRLLLQGTKSRTSEDISDFLDENAIEITTEKKADYIRIKLVCLNEDFENGIEILSDILNNSTFEEYKKETNKIKGEFQADLDSPKVRASDDFYANIFEAHQYGTGRKEILENIEKINKSDLEAAFETFKFEYPKTISFAGDIPQDKVKELFEKYFTELKSPDKKAERQYVKSLLKDKISVIKKEDANQAQIFFGKIFPDIYSEHHAEFVLLNTLLGASGLSSRLFLELREKQGLAYTVRSVYEPYLFGGDFYVYIATEPSNISKSLNGFKKELNKVITTEVSDEELENAKNNAIGKRSFHKETNAGEASLNGYYEFAGLGYEYEEKLISGIKNVTKESLLKTAAEYLSTPSAVTVLAPEKYLKNAGLL